MLIPDWPSTGGRLNRRASRLKMIHRFFIVALALLAGSLSAQGPHRINFSSSAAGTGVLTREDHAAAARESRGTAALSKPSI